MASDDDAEIRRNISIRHFVFGTAILTLTGRNKEAKMGEISNKNNDQTEKIDEMLVLIANARETAREIARLYDQADERNFGLRHLLRVLFKPRRGLWNQVPQVSHFHMQRAQKKSQKLRNLLREIQIKGGEAKVGQVKFEGVNLQGTGSVPIFRTRGSIKQDYNIVDSNQSQLTHLFGELRQLEARVKSIRAKRVEEES